MKRENPQQGLTTALLKSAVQHNAPFVVHSRVMRDYVYDLAQHLKLDQKPRVIVLSENITRELHEAMLRMCIENV